MPEWIAGVLEGWEFDELNGSYCKLIEGIYVDAFVAQDWTFIDLSLGGTPYRITRLISKCVFNRIIHNFIAIGR